MTKRCVTTCGLSLVINVPQSKLVRYGLVLRSCSFSIYFVKHFVHGALALPPGTFAMNCQ